MKVNHPHEVNPITLRISSIKKKFLIPDRSENMADIGTNSVLTSYEQKVPRPVR